jgi:hypothetical protein
MGKKLSIPLQMNNLNGRYEEENKRELKIIVGGSIVQSWDAVCCTYFPTVESIDNDTFLMCVPTHRIR